MSFPKLAVFTYQPLTAPDAFRLVLLPPMSDVSAELECSIEHATLSQYRQNPVNQYAALSYVWGDPTDVRQITVSGCPFHITATLETALRHSRVAGRVIRIWADALCINQADISERNQQVSQMGSIYSLAHHTVIYLGDSTEETDNIFNELAAFGKKGGVVIARTGATADQRSKCRHMADGLKTLILQKPWFYRVWVFQELLLSRDPWLQCGKKRLKWESLDQFVHHGMNVNIRTPPIAVAPTPTPSVTSGSASRSIKVSRVADIPDTSDGFVLLEEMTLARSALLDYTHGKGPGNSVRKETVSWYHVCGFHLLSYLRLAPIDSI
jgi:hypothetical protein